MDDLRVSEEETGTSGRSEPVPTFGVRAAERVYRDRRAAYAVIFGDGDTVAAVRGTSGRFWLPGGGSSPGEAAEETLLREVREELARGVRLVHRIGEAVQFFHAEGDDTYYRMEAAFFLGELTDLMRGAAEHDLVWLPLDQRLSNFFHECHGWAVGQAVAVRQRQGVLLTHQPKNGC